MWYRGRYEHPPKCEIAQACLLRPTVRLYHDPISAWWSHQCYMTCSSDRKLQHPLSRRCAEGTLNLHAPTCYRGIFRIFAHVPDMWQDTKLCRKRHPVHFNSDQYECNWHHPNASESSCRTVLWSALIYIVRYPLLRIMKSKTCCRSPNANNM